MDRSLWPKGPWDNEPDELQWTTQAGLEGRIWRQPSLGHLCGYVGVGEDHVDFEREGDHIDIQEYPHGGITFSGKFKDSDEVWWFGFDCAHVGDTVPATLVFNDSERDRGEEYRDINYVKSEVERLAKSLSERLYA